MSSETQIGEECGDHHELLWGVRRSIRYHNRRRQFFDLLSKWSSFLKLLGGTATLTTVLAKMGPAVITAWATLVAVLSAIDLIFQTSQSARVHSDLARRFNALERKITLESIGPMPKARLAALCAERLEIEADEPPIKRNLDSICHNELCRALDCAPEDYVKLEWYQRGWMAQLFDFKEFTVRRRATQ